MTHTAAGVQAIQAGADAGKPADARYLNPIQVVAAALPRYGFSRQAQIYPQLRVVVSAGGRLYDIYLIQPAAHGPNGIWLINRILPHGTTSPPPPGSQPASRIHFGYVPRSAGQARQIQAGANAGNPGFVYYRNPVQVVMRNLARYGFAGTYTIVSSLKVVVYTGQQGYDVLLSQPAQHGPRGIWLITAIQRHRAG